MKRQRRDFFFSRLLCSGGSTRCAPSKSAKDPKSRAAATRRDIKWLKKLEMSTLFAPPAARQWPSTEALACTLPSHLRSVRRAFARDTAGAFATDRARHPHVRYATNDPVAQLRADRGLHVSEAHLQTADCGATAKLRARVSLLSEAGGVEAQTVDFECRRSVDGLNCLSHREFRDLQGQLRAYLSEDEDAAAGVHTLAVRYEPRFFSGTAPGLLDFVAMRESSSA